MKKIVMLGAAVLALQSIPALAEDHAPMDGKPHRGLEKMFEKQDANKDGAISEEEFLTSSKERFTDMDANKDGKLTKEEVEAKRAEMKKKWEERKAEMKAKKDAEGAPAGDGEKAPE